VKKITILECDSGFFHFSAGRAYSTEVKAVREDYKSIAAIILMQAATAGDIGCSHSTECKVKLNRIRKMKLIIERPKGGDENDEKSHFI
jgi:hypothetical protein